MLTTAYLLANRGRSLKNSTDTIVRFLEKHPNVILFVDESDATDADIGLDGRKIFKQIEKKTKRKDLHYVIARDPEISMNFIYSSGLRPTTIEHKQINKLALKLPQGKSEHYKHHRMIAITHFTPDKENELGFKGLVCITQHNSAFIRPLTRAIQSLGAFVHSRKMQKRYPNHLHLIMRDQNTWIQGEGRIEAFYRWIFGMKSLTDDLDHKYKAGDVETDTGGLNSIMGWIYNSGLWNFINNHIISMADKIESILIPKGLESILEIKSSAQHMDIDGLDHGVLMTIFYNNSNGEYPTKKETGTEKSQDLLDKETPL